jgi:NTE family protein
VPSITHTISAMSGVQLHRYNAATIDLMETYIKQLADELSTPENLATPYFIEVSFEDFKERSGRLFLNKIPTSFSLSDEEVDKLIEAGRTLLRNHPDFKRLLADIKNS